MEETAECSDALEVFVAMAIDRPGCSAKLDAARSGGMADGHWGGKVVLRCNRDGDAGLRSASRSDTRKRPPLGRVAAAPTFDRQVEEPWSSCLIPAHWRCADRGAAREDVDDDHRCAAVPADEDGAGFDDGVVR